MMFSPIFIETEDNLRTFNTNELTRNDNIFILFSQSMMGQLWW